MTTRPNKSDIEEINTLMRDVQVNGSKWRFDGTEYNLWAGRVKDLIRRNYPIGEHDERLREFDKASDYRRTILVRRPGVPDRRAEIFQADFQKNLPLLIAFAQAMHNDISIRAASSETETQLLGDSRPIIFIAHGGQTENRDYLELFLWRRGYRPIIVEELPSLGKSPDDKVDHYMSRCQFGIIFAEVNRAAIQDGKPYPRLNIIDEMVRIRKTLGNRFIVLLEESLSLNSNEQVTYERFTQDTLGKACDSVLKELEGHSIKGSDELEKHS